MRAMRSPEHARAVGLMAAAALCWSLGGLLIKSVAWPPLAVAGGRGFIAAAFLAVFAPRFRFTWSAAQLGGALAYAGTTILFVTANKLTTAANAILLQYTAPVWIALLGAWFLGERATRADWLTIAVVFGGMTLFFCDDLRLSGLAGNLVALASGVAFASMTLLLRKQKDTSAVESIFLGNLLAGAVGVPFMFHSGPLPDATSWIALGLLGTVQLGLSYLLYSRAIRHVTALEAVLIPVIEPILNPVWVLLTLGERPGPLSLVGGVIVLTAVTLRMLHNLRSPAGATTPPPAAV
jgi:drug/metabolite transporter (DMT)-like permease